MARRVFGMIAAAKPGAAAPTANVAGLVGSRQSGYASPDVSSITASSAARADWPAQITNWKAG